MMQRDDILFLFNYNYWANQLILSACSQITQQQYVAPGPLSHGSLRATMVHTLAVETLWRLRCQGGNPAGSLPTEADLPDFAHLMIRWREEENNMRAYLNSLSDETLNQTVAYQTSQGKPFENVLWQLLAHVVNHGTQCRSEAAIRLTECGHSPGDLDLLYFFRKK